MNQKPRHTPEPWRIDKDPRRILNPAAIPALIEALDDCTTLLASIHADMPWHRCGIGCPDIGRYVAQARAALATAKDPRVE